MFFAQSYVSAFDGAGPPAGAAVEFDPRCAPLAIRVSALVRHVSTVLKLRTYFSSTLTPFVCPQCSRYSGKLGKYWLGPIDPTRPHDEPQGGYGLVKAGINSETGERVCCKLSHLEYEGTEAQRLEIVLQAGLKHVNVVNLKDVVFEKPAGRPKKQLCMIMELVAGGELFSEVVDQGGFGEDKARFYFRQILEGMAYCHTRKLAHRDIKLENLLLTGDRQFVKIAGFELAKSVSEPQYDKYVAPEMCTWSGKVLAEYDGFKSDMWACGVCLYAMTECRFPFMLRLNARRGSLPSDGGLDPDSLRSIQKAQYELNPERSPEYVAFLKRLLCPDAATRCIATEALMDPWILMGGGVTAAWTVDEVVAKVDAMDSSSMVVPTGYAQSEWVEQLKRVMTAKGDAEDDEEEAGFAAQGGGEDEPEMQDGEDEDDAF